MFTSELVIAESSAGNQEMAKRRLQALENIQDLLIDDEVERLAERLIEKGAVPSTAKADALHIAVAAVHQIDFLLTWNCRHIDNAASKPIFRMVCAESGYTCPEICTPLELLGEDFSNV